MNPGEEIDRKRLRALVARIHAWHAERLAAALASVAPEQRGVLEALPVLLHANHAALPGFVDFDTPAGIDGYAPDERAIEATRKLALSFTLERFRERVHQLRALFIIGPESERERAFDVWVIAPRATAAALEPKLRGIAAFARRVDLVLRLRVVDPLDARNPRATADARIPRLALERFYREGIRIAGRLPLWWLVPPALDARYAEYAERLLAQRHVKADDVVDLGGLGAIPLGECVDAAVELLERTLDRPFVHLPWLTLIESYIDGAPLLAERNKAELHEAERAAPTEAGALVHSLLEGHLGTHDAARLALVRQCFVEGRKRELVDAAAAAWSWSSEERRRLVSRASWRLHDYLAQDRELRASLEATRSRLDERARAGTGTSTLARLAAIAARLAPPSSDAAIAGFLSHAFVPAQAQVRLALRGEARAWRLEEAEERVYDAGRLTRAALYLHAHGLSAAHVSVGHGATRVRLGRLLSAFDREIERLAGDTVLLVVNAEESPTGARAERAEDGDALVTDRDDALDFSGFRTSLVQAIDVVARRGGAFEIESAIGNDGVRAAIARAAGARASAIACIDSGHARVIEERLAELIADARAALERGARFVFGLAATFVVLEPGEPVRANAFPTYAAAAAHLGTSNPRAEIRIDRRATVVADLARSAPSAAERRSAPPPR